MKPPNGIGNEGNERQNKKYVKVHSRLRRFRPNALMGSRSTLITSVAPSFYDCTTLSTIVYISFLRLIRNFDSQIDLTQKNGVFENIFYHQSLCDTHVCSCFKNSMVLFFSAEHIKCLIQPHVNVAVLDYLL